MQGTLKVRALNLWRQVGDQAVLQLPPPVVHHEFVVASLVDAERPFWIVERIRLQRDQTMLRV